MAYIVKKHPKPEAPQGFNFPVAPERFDFYTVETVKDITDKDVQIPKLEGSYSLVELVKRKDELETVLADVIIKIDIINNLK